MESKIDKYKDLKFMLCSSDSNGCGLMRVVQPALFLKQHLPWTEYSLGFPPNDPRLLEADVILLQRANSDFFKEWIPKAKESGKKLIFDVDDLMWNIPASNLAWRHYNRKELDKLNWVMMNCDAVTTSTIPLGQEIQKIFENNRKTCNPVIIPNMYHTPLPFKKPKNEKVRIGWHGSYTHNGDFDNHLVKALREVVNARPDEVEFHTYGFCPQWAKPFCKQTEWADIDKFMPTLINLNFDIGIIVAETNDFNKCKSNLKYIEYSLAKTASIAHNVYPYATTIEDEYDGYLVKNNKTDWKKYINMLIDDEELRNTVATRANKKVMENFTFELNGDSILDRYSQVFEQLGF